MPDPKAKVVHALQYEDETHRYFVFVFDDGAVWTKCGKTWSCQWNPAIEANG